MYTSSKKPAQRAMKILYKKITDPLGILEKQPYKIEELQLPKNASETLRTDLKKNTSLLPSSARTHQEWTISLLDRC